MLIWPSLVNVQTGFLASRPICKHVYFRLEHVQEYTKALEESSDEEEDEMPSIQLKGHTRGSPVSTSDKISVSQL